MGGIERCETGLQDTHTRPGRWLGGTARIQSPPLLFTATVRNPSGTGTGIEPNITRDVRTTTNLIMDGSKMILSGCLSVLILQKCVAFVIPPVPQSTGLRPSQHHAASPSPLHVRDSSALSCQTLICLCARDVARVGMTTNCLDMLVNTTSLTPRRLCPVYSCCSGWWPPSCLGRVFNL